MNFDKENIDFLLFEYMEGNLSKQQEYALLEHLERNPDLKEELDYWKKSTFSDTLTDKTELKNQILFTTIFKKFDFKFAFSIGITFIVTLSVLLLSLPDKDIKDTPELTNIKNRNTTGTTILHKNVANFTNESQLENHVFSNIISPDKPKKKSEERKVEYNPDIMYEIPVKYFEVPKLQLHPTLIQDSVIAITSPDSAEKTSITERKTTKLTKSKKELRKIERLKIKAMENRHAQEFLKGNKPYVVPPNPDF